VHEQDHERQTSARDIVRVFSDYIRRKYVPIQVEEECIRKMLQAGYGHLSNNCRDTTGTHYRRRTKSSGVQWGQQKNPGKDGIRLEFFKVFWENMASDMRTLFTQMFRDHTLIEKQEQAVIVCIPKGERPNTPEDCRPITLLDTDYKILARL